MLESKFQSHDMATAIQNNGMKALSNGTLNHVENVGSLGDSTLCSAAEPYKCPQEPVEEAPEIDILIRNVVCSFSVRCHLNLRDIALKGSNVEYKRENGMITMKLRRPMTTASIWSSGKVTCTGAETEPQAKIAARKIARSLQKLGFKVRLSNFRVVNVLGTCLMPWAIRITSFSQHHKEIAEYEPELHPGVTYKLQDIKATLKIFSTGSVTITAPSVAAVGAAIERIFPLVYEFRIKRSVEDEQALLAKKRKSGRRYRDHYDNSSKVKVDVESEEEVEEMQVESDASWD